MYAIVVFTEEMTGNRDIKAPADPYIIAHEEEEMVGALKIEEMLAEFRATNPFPQMDENQEPDAPNIELFLEWLASHHGYAWMITVDYPMVWSDPRAKFVDNLETP